MHSWPSEEGEGSPLAGITKVRGCGREDRKCREQSFALSTPWRVPLWPWAVLAHQPPSLFTPVVSAEFMVSCEKKRLGNSADFRWRCLWTLVKFQGSYIWKRLRLKSPTSLLPVCPFGCCRQCKQRCCSVNVEVLAGSQPLLGNPSMCLCFLPSNENSSRNIFDSLTYVQRRRSVTIIPMRAP